MGRFDGRVALITGAASGIGRATAIRMATDGASIVGFDRDADGLTSVAAEIANSGGAEESWCTQCHSEAIGIQRSVPAMAYAGA